MASNYPDSFDSLDDPVGTDPLSSPAHAALHVSENDAIEAVQATLGLNPEGSYATVAERMSEVDTAAAAAEAAQVAAELAQAAAEGAATDAGDAANLAEDWAVQLVDPVSGGEYSAKYHAQAAASSATAAAASATSAASSAASVDATATTATEFRQFAADGSVLANLPARVHPAEQLLKQAVWWIDAAHSSASGQSVSNLGWGGSALDAQLGSSGSADSNDPKYLDWQGENYVYLPGAAGNYLLVPDEAALDITGDIDIRGDIALDDWTPSGGYQYINYNLSANTGYALGVTTGGNLYLAWGNGSAYLSATSTTSAGVTDGARKWIRGTLDVDNGAAGHDVKFYTSDDGVTWSQLGTTVTTAGTTSIAASAVNVTVAGSTITTGKIHRAQVLSGISGTPVLDVDCSQIASGADTSFTALTGQTVTISRSTSGRKTVGVVHPRWLFGTDDYMQVADNALLDFGASDSFTVLAVVRQWATPTNFGAYVTKKAATGAGWVVVGRQTTYRPAAYLHDATSSVNKYPATTQTLGTSQVFGMVVDRSANLMYPVMDGALDASANVAAIGDSSNSAALNLGRQSDGTLYADMEFTAAAIFRRALTAGEIATLTSYFQGREGA